MWPEFVLTKKQFLEPTFKMSNTGLKVEDFCLHCADVPLVGQVLLSRDEAQVSGLVSPVNVSPVQFQSRDIPSFKCDNVLEKRSAIIAPRFVHVDASSAIMLEAAVVGVMASIDTSG
jgi:hypothetical protein